MPGKDGKTIEIARKKEDMSFEYYNDEEDYVSNEEISEQARKLISKRLGKLSTLLS